MKTRTLLTLFALILSLSASAAAQQAPDQQRNEQLQQRVQDLKERLNLTPEQAEQVRPIIVEEMQQLKAVRDKYSGDQSRRSRMKMGREMKGVQNATNDKLKNILTKQQMDELRKIREESRQEMRQRRKR